MRSFLSNSTVDSSIWIHLHANRGYQIAHSTVSVKWLKLLQTFPDLQFQTIFWKFKLQQVMATRTVITQFLHLRLYSSQAVSLVKRWVKIDLNMSLKITRSPLSVQIVDMRLQTIINSWSDISSLFIKAPLEWMSVKCLTPVTSATILNWRTTFSNTSLICLPIRFFQKIRFVTRL